LHFEGKCREFVDLRKEFSWENLIGKYICQIKILKMQGLGEIPQIGIFLRLSLNL
jgi:hypothetical protein